MNKKALSLLLALSMVFSLNTVAFAEEANEDVVAVEATEEVDDTDSINSQSSNTQSVNVLSDGSIVVYNSTPLFTGKKFSDAKMLNIKATVSGLSVSSQLTATKIKVAKGTKKDYVGTVKFGISKFDNAQVKALSKDDKKKVKAFIKTQKSSLPLAMVISPFSVSYNNVTAETSKKPSKVSENSYVVTVTPNKKDTKATVAIWSLNSKGKMVKSKLKKGSYSYSNKTVTFTGSQFDKNYKLVISGNSVVEQTVSGN